MSILSDYKRHVSDPLEASLRATVAKQRKEIETLTAQVAEAEWIINEHHLFALAQLKRDGKKPATRGAGLELHQRTKAWMEARLAAAKEPS